MFVKTNESKAAAAVRISAALALGKRGDLSVLLRPCFARTQVWLQAGKYVAALMSELPERNGYCSPPILLNDLTRPLLSSANSRQGCQRPSTAAALEGLTCGVVVAGIRGSRLSIMCL